MNDAWYVCYEAKLMLVDVVGMRPDTELAHRRLCDLVWATGKGLVDDDDCLRDACRVKPQDWARVKGELMQKGWLSENGLFTHRGAARLGTMSRNKAEKRKAAAEAGATARWAEKQSVGTADAKPKHNESTADAKPPQSGCHAILDLESESKLKVQGSDKASKLLTKGGSKGGTAVAATSLARLQAEVARYAESVLNGQWVNDAGKWVERIKTEPERVLRVMAEVKNAVQEGRCKTTPAQMAQWAWDEVVK